MYPISSSQAKVTFASSAVSSPAISISQSAELPASMQLSLKDFSKDPMLSFAQINLPKENGTRPWFERVLLSDFDTEHQLESADLTSMNSISLIDEASISNLNEQGNLPFSDVFSPLNFAPYIDDGLEEPIQQQIILNKQNANRNVNSSEIGTETESDTESDTETESGTETGTESERSFYKAPAVLHRADEACTSESCTRVTKAQIRTLYKQVDLCKTGLKQRFFRQKLRALIKYYTEEGYHQEKAEDKKKLFVPVNRSKIDIKLVEHWSFAYLHGGLPLLRGCCNNWVNESKKNLLIDGTQLLELYTTLTEGSQVSFCKLAKKYGIAQNTLKDRIMRMGLSSRPGQKKFVFENNPNNFPKSKRACQNS